MSDLCNILNILLLLLLHSNSIVKKWDIALQHVITISTARTNLK
jgi:hypothetical protein